MATWKIGNLVLGLVAGLGLMSGAGRVHAQGTGAPAASGTVLASDNFSNPDTGLLPKSTQNPQWKVGYGNGEYQIASAGSMVGGGFTALIRGTFEDVSIAADARITGGTDSPGDETVRLECRRQADGSGYRFNFQPDQNGWILSRVTVGVANPLNPVQFLNGAPSITATHHLQLTCSGSTISASIDGNQVSSMQDSSYQSGRAGLGVGSWVRVDANGNVEGAYPGVYDARFSNLVLTQP